MPGHRHCGLIVLVSLLEGVLMGTGNVSKSGCYGDSVALYSNISINDNFTVVSVYKNGDHNNWIGRWSRKNSMSSSSFAHEYMNKLTLDNNGNIWIHWLQISDEAEYNINIDKGNGSSDNVVQLALLVPPTTNCKPKIERINDVLTVFLETMDCGRPAASVYWLNNSGIFHKDSKAIELQPRNRAGIYYACIEGDALRCAKISRFSEYCSALTVDEEQPLSEKERAGDIRDNTDFACDATYILQEQAICFSLLFMLMIIPIYRLMRWKNEASPMMNSQRDLFSTGSEETHSQLPRQPATDSTPPKS